MKQITWTDLLTLAMLEDQPDLSVRRLHREVNGFIDMGNIPTTHGMRRKHKRSTELSLQRLRAVGLVREAPKNEITPSGATLLELLGVNVWRWPYYIPVVDGRLDFDNRKER